ncbi:flagellar basal body P-ring formation protein FlgA [Paraburkholderia sp. CNPSo 3272]|uniref:flagellar basal body P-ring formation chaperone FlgA n=1 Tax=Paraburkholderia sp. CNPSo 3272 TaxID=2940931 RepID=UPI0020B7F7FC|nr:flagellar basal body P-ring formation chaperone FlgA [Paraburkholderia sp. CNPSo 3272]MCP3726537.1 flagellar basal body P-ring formation protein FlgA [Paraburkholderia sp. CNPSo 3272]
MPQTATLHRPHAGLERRVRALSWRASWTCVLACAFGGALAHAQTPAQPEAAGGQIFIAGPGDRSGADAAQMNALLASNAKKPAAAAASNTPPNEPAVEAAPLRAASYADLNSRGVPEDARAGIESNGMITIPGPGERAPQGDAPRIVTVPAPGASAQPMRVPAANATNAGTLQRVNLASAANRVAPVVVDAGAGTLAKPVAGASAGAPPNPNTSAVATNVQATPPGQQDGESIRAAALAFLQQQSAGLPGHVSITVAPVFPRGLAACTSLEPFMPPGARTYGHTTVGVRCIGAKPWTLYVSARIAVDVTYYVASRQIGAGEALSAADFMPRAGDLANLPQTIITDPNQATGAVALARISAGLPLRTDMLRSAASVVIGQTVKVIAVGSNFTISAEGSALNNAEPGQQVRVRTSGGQIISGVVKDAGTVQVQI